MRFLSLILFFTISAAAQVADGITASVTRTVTLTPDEADFTAVLTAPLDTTQDQITQILNNAGIQNFNSVSVTASRSTNVYPPPAQSQLFFQVTFKVAPAALKDFAQRLEAMRGNLPAPLAGLDYYAALGVSQPAIDTAHQAAVASLLADARSRAQTIAAAAGLKLGAIQGVSESVQGSPISTYAVLSSTYVPSTVVGSGTQFTFYATVKFAAQ
jgi:hypothetical protein